MVAIFFISFAPMLTQIEIETRLKAIKPLLANQFHVTKIGYFGSYANGDFNEDSDLDLLVEFSQPVGWEFFRLERYLEEYLGIKIDLVTLNAIRASMKAKILKDVKYC